MLMKAVVWNVMGLNMKEKHKELRDPPPNSQSYRKASSNKAELLAAIDSKN